MTRTNATDLPRRHSHYAGCAHTATRLSARSRAMPPNARHGHGLLPAQLAGVRPARREAR